MKKVIILIIVIFSCFSYSQDNDSIYASYPQTLEAGIDTLMRIISSEDLFILKNTVKEKLGYYHMDLGLGIRNSFGLWARSGIYQDIARLVNDPNVHPDEASSIIIEKFWERLQTTNLNFHVEKSDPVKIDSIIINSKPILTIYIKIALLQL